VLFVSDTPQPVNSAVVNPIAIKDLFIVIVFLSQCVDRIICLVILKD
jgi:hypothetical protein